MTASALRLGAPRLQRYRLRARREELGQGDICTRDVDTLRLGVVGRRVLVTVAASGGLRAAFGFARRLLLAGCAAATAGARSEAPSAADAITSVANTVLRKSVDVLCTPPVFDWCLVSLDWSHRSHGEGWREHQTAAQPVLVCARNFFRSIDSLRAFLPMCMTAAVSRSLVS